MPSRPKSKRGKREHVDTSELKPGFHFLYVPPTSGGTEKNENVFIRGLNVHQFWRFGTNSINLWILIDAVLGTVVSIVFYMCGQLSAFVVQLAQDQWPLDRIDPSLALLEGSLSWIGTISTLAIAAGVALLAIFKVYQQLFSKVFGRRS